MEIQEGKIMEAYKEIELIKEKIISMEKRISLLEHEPEKLSIIGFQFKDNKKDHSELLEELLSSDYCYKKGGLTYEEILNVFEDNHRPVSSKKIYDLLCVWVSRKKVDTKKKGNKLAYFK